MDMQNQARGRFFLLGVLRSQGADPFCRVCSAYKNTLAAARESFTKGMSSQEAEFQDLPVELASLLADAEEGMAALAAPEDATGQKRAGNCRLPEGQCFIKSSFAFLQRI